DLGLQPHYLGDTLIESVIDVVERHASRVDPVELEQPNVDWRRGGTANWRKPVKKATVDRDASQRPVVVSSKAPSPTLPARGTEKSSVRMLSANHTCTSEIGWSRAANSAKYCRPVAIRAASVAVTSNIGRLPEPSSSMAT